jgi:hypothetical protein
VLGLVFYVYCKAKYKEEFGRHIDVEFEDIDEQVKNPVRAKGVLE